MLEMKVKGWVTSVMGKQGGYVLAKSPEELPLGVIRHFDGCLAHRVRFVNQYERCNQEWRVGSAVVSGGAKPYNGLMDAATLARRRQAVRREKSIRWI